MLQFDLDILVSEIALVDGGIEGGELHAGDETEGQLHLGWGVGRVRWGGWGGRGRAGRQGEQQQDAHEEDV